MSPRRPGRRPPKRLVATKVRHISLTEEGDAAIQTWAETHDVSFSAAIESLARLGMGQVADSAFAPIVVSTIKRELSSTQDRLIRLLLYAIMESGTAARLAGATLYRQRPADTPLKDWNSRYRAIKQHARMDARRALAHPHISTLIEELYGDRQGKLPDPDAGGDDGENDESDQPSSEVLHLSGGSGSGPAAVAPE